MNTSLTNRIENYAIDLGADLVGIANIERFKNAPVMMSPQGIMPSAEAVVVLAIHHPDSIIQLDGEKSSQILKTYNVQMTMNQKLDDMAFKIANFIDMLGYEAVPIASSNIWRYRNFMNLEANFAPDMSHIYAATCAGLGQLGWNGLTTTPEYGAWNRFVSIITDAPLDATPLYDETKLCDMCGECIRHCPTDAYRKEVNGANILEVEGKQYRFANKNLWRCAWAEHFQLDLDLDIPEKVDEQVILDYRNKYGRRGGEMGYCLKYCLPPQLRIKDESYTTTYIRKRPVIATDLPPHRALYNKIVNTVSKYAVDAIAFLDAETCKNAGLDPADVFKDARTAIVYSISIKISDGSMQTAEVLNSHSENKGEKFSGPYSGGMKTLKEFTGLDIARLLESSGYNVYTHDFDKAEMYARLACLSTVDGDVNTYGVVYTTAAFSKRLFTGLLSPMDNPHLNPTGNLIEELKRQGIDLYGVVKAGTVAKIADELEMVKGGEEVLLARDTNDLFMPYKPEVVKVKRKLNKPADYLKSARNILVLGMHYPSRIARNALKAPAYAVGPYMFAQYEASNQLNYIGIKLCKYLQCKGYNAVFTHDLLGVGSDIGSPRGFLNDAFCNCFEAAAARIGQLTKIGTLYTEKYGLNQRFISIVTDAPLDEISSEPVQGVDINEICGNCDKCTAVCPAKAIQPEKAVSINVGGKSCRYIPVDTKRCDWSKKYALCPEDGNKYTGSNTDVAVPDEVTTENLSDALSTSDNILKFRPCTAELCIIDCPLTEK